MAAATTNREGPAPPILNDEEAQLAKAAQRCLVKALDHSRAHRIALVDENNEMGDDLPVLELPPKALRFIATVLGALGERKPIVLLPQKHELTTVQAAAVLNVSRPFIIKEIEANRLKCRLVGAHRRIAYEDLMEYKSQMKTRQEDALQRLANEAQQNDMGY